ncbi:MAG TPA: bifunctional adenosylcobinamide kinase/adenosylcobinamide-phosphate guanylyltransferase [Paludibacter sp.]|nr:bifunctional adenosylcobinamide kinase/adenosylcobinamide-phosphate guanylyltransferase [Paludibacter sp.]
MEKATKKIILVTGGQRSGKSSYAQKLALSLAKDPVYLATSAVWDEEHRQRIERHKRDRGAEWTNIEELTELQDINIEGRVVVIDCVTLWATNFFAGNNGDTEQSLKEIKNRFNHFTQQDATFIFVTNEIGLGGISADDLQRRFTDLIGWVNQHIAQNADEVILMVSGIPVHIK